MATRSSTKQSARMALVEREADATRQLQASLQLSVKSANIKLLGTALAEIAAAESRRNAQFADAVRQRYVELVETFDMGDTRGGTSDKTPLPPLVPIRRDTTYREIDPFKPPDPAFLIYVYGKGQLSRALQDYTVDSLKLTAADVESRHPGTKPTNRGRKDALIAYIVAHSAGD